MAQITNQSIDIGSMRLGSDFDPARKSMTLRRRKGVTASASCPFLQTPP
jgi:hypothetical protein